MNFTISIPNFTQVFGSAFHMPIVVDKGARFEAFPRAKRARRMIVTLDSVLKSSARHLFTVPPNPQPSQKLVDEWIATLAWQMAMFWHIDPARAEIFPKDSKSDPSLFFSWEHSRYSGELLAEAFAITFLDRYLRIGAHQVYFYEEGGSPRPDFVLTDPSTGFVLRNGNKCGLEAKSRKYDNFSFGNAERVALRSKKHTIASVLGVYFNHGRRLQRSKHPAGKTRLFITDPPGEDRPVNVLERARIAVEHYARIAVQVGLPHEREILSEMLLEVRNGTLPERPKIPPPAPAIRLASRRFGESVYQGRFISTLLRDTPARDAQRAEMDAGRYGDVIFFGLNREVRELIRLRDAWGLASYYDRSAGKVDALGISGDGVMFRVMRVMPGSEEAEWIRGARA
jgi:hypothetical protein